MAGPSHGPCSTTPIDSAAMERIGLAAIQALTASLSCSVDPAVESTVLRVLLQLTVIILTARLLSIVFRLLGQPSVVGEIIGGLLLGPSFFGRFFPGAFQAVFDPALDPLFNVISQIGLVLLLFLIGLEFDFGHLRQKGKAAWLISWTGILLPFVTGYALGVWMHSALALGVSRVGFCLFMGTAMSITAIPILGRIMMELNLTRSSVGAVTITAAAFDDASGWIILAAISTLVRSGFDVGTTLGMAGMTIGFCLAMMYVVRPALIRLISLAFARTGGNPGYHTLAVVLAVLFVCSIATNLIGIFSIFGAFLLGAILSDQGKFREWINANMQKFVTVFFLPVFFTFTGLRTDVGTLESPTLWFFAALVLFVAVAGKFGGCTVAARFGGFSWRSSACIGVMMNTRALMELIVINVGYELGVVPRSVYVMLVIMAVVTTLMATPVLLRASRGTELAPLIRASPFVQSRWRAT